MALSEESPKAPAVVPGGVSLWAILAVRPAGYVLPVPMLAARTSSLVAAGQEVVAAMPAAPLVVARLAAPLVVALLSVVQVLVQSHSALFLSSKLL